MKQLMFEGAGKLRWREVPEPTLLTARDALVRPVAVARCDLDAAFMTKPFGRALRVALASHLAAPEMLAITGRPPFDAPFAVGHECVAEVVEIGSEVTHVCPGERVVVPFQVACGRCKNCQRGMTSRCTASTLPVNNYGFGPGAHVHAGVMTDLVRVPFADAMLVPVPDGVDAAAIASASDNLPDAYRSVAPALAAEPEAPVLVVGGAAQSVGLYAVAMARALGASVVTYHDHDSARLAIAEALGATAVEARRSRTMGPYECLPDRYPISVDASSDLHGRGLELALRSLQPGGTCTVVGMYFRARTPVPMMQMYLDGVTLRTGITNARALIPEVLRLVAEGKLDPSPVTTLLAPWNEADAALCERTTKVIVTR